MIGYGNEPKTTSPFLPCSRRHIPTPNQNLQLDASKKIGSCIWKLLATLRNRFAFKTRRTLIPSHKWSRSPFSAHAWKLAGNKRNNGRKLKTTSSAYEKNGMGQNWTKKRTQDISNSWQFLAETNSRAQNVSGLAQTAPQRSENERAHTNCALHIPRA